MFVAVALALALIYRFGPSREAPRGRRITWGSVIATIMWLGASGLFSWYATSFGKFNETYGSLGAAIGFMTWLWISAIVILLGAELDGRYGRRGPRRVIVQAAALGSFSKVRMQNGRRLTACGPPAKI